MSSELRSILPITSLYVIRMLGLFMVLPVLATYGQSLSGANPATLGLALGIYGLTQAIFQIPLGLLSDFVGRKRVILLGLAAFTLGSLVAAMAHSVIWLIIGRALQGSGAIASTIMALVADVTSEENRTKAMAAIGASIGLSFSLALVCGAPLAAFAGLKGLFLFSAFLGLLGIGVAGYFLPEIILDPIERRQPRKLLGSLLELMGDAQLMRAFAGVFTLHAVMTALFIVVPGKLTHQLGIAHDGQWKVYLPVLLGSFVLAVPAILVAERMNQMKPAFVSAVLIVAAALVTFYFSSLNPLVVPALLLFFLGFNALEAMLPSLVSKICPAGSKGGAMGLYSTSQFFGAFVGGSVGGLLVVRGGESLLFLAALGLVAIWALLALTMRRPKNLSRLCFNVSRLNDLAAVLRLEGVEEASYHPDEGLLYLKVEERVLNRFQLNELLSPFQRP